MLGVISSAPGEPEETTRILGTVLTHLSILSSTVRAARSPGPHCSTWLIRVAAGELLISDGQNAQLKPPRWPTQGSNPAPQHRQAPAQGRASRTCSPARRLACLLAAARVRWLAKHRRRKGQSCQLRPCCYRHGAHLPQPCLDWKSFWSEKKTSLCHVSKTFRFWPIQSETAERLLERKGKVRDPTSGSWAGCQPCPGLGCDIHADVCNASPQELVSTSLAFLSVFFF